VGGTVGIMQAVSVRKHSCQDVRICEILDGCQWNCVETTEKEEEDNYTAHKRQWSAAIMESGLEKNHSHVRPSPKLLLFIIDCKCDRTTASTTKKDIARRCVRLMSKEHML
jgi:hypothetical protein